LSPPRSSTGAPRLSEEDPLREQREVPTLLEEADVLLRRGDVDGAVRLVEELRGLRAALGGGDERAGAERLRLRVRGALQYRLVEASGLTPAARDEVRVALALGALFGISASHLLARLWPTLAQEQYSFLVLDRFAQRLREVEASQLDTWLRHILNGMSGHERDGVRAEMLIHHAYFTVLHSSELVDLERHLLARPPRLGGVRVQALRRSGCPVCVWPDVVYTARNLPQLPTLPAHPGCRCLYRPVSLGG
jgi:hypothetical protein